MILTEKQFKEQNAFWQDKWYSYAIHKTSGGAIYLYRIDCLKINKKPLENMQVFRLDGIDKKQFFENLEKFL
jgi:hypothetical protein